MADTASDPTFIKAARTDHPILDWLRLRWSPRAFADRAVPKEHLRSCLEAARWAASSRNGQPWFFLIATQDQPLAFARLVGCLNEANATWAARAPVLGILVARLIGDDGRPNRHAFFDVGLAMQNLVIQATALGLFVHQMAGFSVESAREAFAIPADHEPVVAFALGYLGDPNQLSAEHRRLELMPRERRPLTSFVFTERWGETSSLLAP